MATREYIVDRNGRLRDRFGRYVKAPRGEVEVRPAGGGPSYIWKAPALKSRPKRKRKPRQPGPSKPRPSKPRPSKPRPSKPRPPKPPAPPAKPRPPSRRPPAPPERKERVLQSVDDVLRGLGLDPATKVTLGGKERRKDRKTETAELHERMQFTLNEARRCLLEVSTAKEFGIKVVDDKSTLGVDRPRVHLNADGTVDGELKIIMPTRGLTPREAFLMIERCLRPVAGTWITAGLRFWSPEDLKDQYKRHRGMAQINSWYVRNTERLALDQALGTRTKNWRLSLATGRDLSDRLDRTRRRDGRKPDKVEQVFIRLHWNYEGWQPDRNGRPMKPEKDKKRGS